MGLIDFSLGDIGGVITSIREALTGERIKDPTEMAKVQLQLESLDQALKTGQLEINKVEAASSSAFVAGWRPFLGWVAGIAFAYQFVLYPIILWAWAAWGLKGISPPPVMDVGALMTLLAGLLGLGGMRSFDKLKGTDTKKIG